MTDLTRSKWPLILTTNLGWPSTKITHMVASVLFVSHKIALVSQQDSLVYVVMSSSSLLDDNDEEEGTAWTTILSINSIFAISWRQISNWGRVGGCLCLNPLVLESQAMLQLHDAQLCVAVVCDHWHHACLRSWKKLNFMRPPLDGFWAVKKLHAFWNCHFSGFSCSRDRRTENYYQVMGPQALHACLSLLSLALWEVPSLSLVDDC